MSLATPAATTPSRALPDWPALKLLLVYRAVLWGVLFITLGPPPARLAAWMRNPDLVAWGLLAYLALLILGLSLVWRQWPSIGRQVQWSVLGDIGVLSLLMYATGGASHGLGLLIAVSVVLGSLLSVGTLSLAFAAAASLAVIAAELLLELREPGIQSALPQAGLLGLTYFAVALLALAFARRLRETEQIALQQETDLIGLAKLNEHIVGRMDTGVLVLGPGGDIRLANRAAVRLLGNHPLARGTMLTSIAPTLAAALRGLETRATPAPLVVSPFAGGAASRITLEPLGSGPQPGLLVFLEDQALQEQRAQELKLASLGRLSASIAHEIRNPLGAIGHASQLLAESDEAPDTRRELLGIIERNVHRLNDIVESVLQLSRRDAAMPERLPLGEWLEVFAKEFTGSQGPDRVGLHLEMEPDLPPVAVDPRQLRQILSILGDNARKHGGANAETGIRIRARHQPERETLTIEVIDPGPGIPPEVKPYIFDPFFTTDPQGTGLGLYLAKELCEANRILLDPVSLPEGGGCLRLTFPPQSLGEEPS